MNGGGRMSTRLPGGLLRFFRAWCVLSASTTHNMARFFLFCLSGFPDDEFLELPDPPPELLNHWVTFNVGSDALRELEELSSRTHLSCSTIFRRVLHGFLVTQEIYVAQVGNGSEFTFARKMQSFEGNWQPKEESVCLLADRPRGENASS